MNDEIPDSIHKFNRLYSDERLNKLKIISSHFTEYPLNMLAVLIKIMECRYLLSDILSKSKHHQTDNKPLVSIDELQSIGQEILPFCSPEEQNMINNLLNMYKNMENMKEMMQMMELMKAMSGDGTNENGENNTGNPFGMGGMGGMNGMSGMADILSGMSGTNGMADILSSMMGGSGMDFSELLNMFNGFSA